MKKILVFLFFIVTAAFAVGQKTNHVVSFDGIGELKLGMGKAELEKLLNIKIVLKHIGVDEIYAETVQAKYLGKDVALHLMRSEDKVAILDGLGVTDPIFKTVDGMGIGTQQSTIVDKYEDQLLIIHPDFLDNNPRRRTIITLADMDN